MYYVVIIKASGTAGVSFSPAAVALYRETPDGTGPYWLENAQCSPTNVRLTDCPQSYSGQCAHYQDVGARCAGMVTISRIESNSNLLRTKLLSQLFPQKGMLV